MLGKNMAKFCSGDYNPDAVPAGSSHLDPLLSTASKSPPAQVPVKGLDGNFIDDFYFWARSQQKGKTERDGGVESTRFGLANRRKEAKKPKRPWFWGPLGSVSH